MGERNVERGSPFQQSVVPGGMVGVTPGRVGVGSGEIPFLPPASPPGAMAGAGVGADAYRAGMEGMPLIPIPGMPGPMPSYQEILRREMMNRLSAPVPTLADRMEAMGGYDAARAVGREAYEAAMGPYPSWQSDAARRLALQNSMSGFTGQEAAQDYAAQFRNPPGITPRDMVTMTESQRRMLRAAAAEQSQPTMGYQQQPRPSLNVPGGRPTTPGPISTNPGLVQMGVQPQRSPELQGRLDLMSQLYGIGGRLGNTADFGTSSEVTVTPSGAHRITPGPMYQIPDAPDGTMTSYRPGSRSPALGGGIPTVTLPDGSIAHRDIRGMVATPSADRAALFAEKKLGRQQMNAARSAGVPYVDGMSRGDIWESRRRLAMGIVPGGLPDESQTHTEVTGAQLLPHVKTDSGDDVPDTSIEGFKRWVGNLRTNRGADFGQEFLRTVRSAEAPWNLNEVQSMLVDWQGELERFWTGVGALLSDEQARQMGSQVDEINLVRGALGMDEWTPSMQRPWPFSMLPRSTVGPSPLQ